MVCSDGDGEEVVCIRGSEKLGRLWWCEGGEKAERRACRGRRGLVVGAGCSLACDQGESVIMQLGACAFSQAVMVAGHVVMVVVSRRSGSLSFVAGLG